MTFQVVLSYHPGILLFGCREDQVLGIARCSGIKSLASATRVQSFMWRYSKARATQAV